MCAELHCYPEVKAIRLADWITLDFLIDKILWLCFSNYYFRVHCIEKVEFVINARKRAPHIVLNVDMVQLERHHDFIYMVLINSADFG